ncbi:MAG: hypothetical protein FWF81_08190 [Defluviitaleaceae bacterium]|nr:hypothetical protein [Defluviitaleaceae bacterium]
MKGIIIKDDARYDYTEKYLQNKGYHLGSELKPEELDFAIFPFMEDADKSIYNDDFFSRLRKNIIVFSGIKNSYLSEKCAAHKINYLIMMDDDGIKVKNAVPTSEGVIAYLVNNLSRTVAYSKILVIGYGVCGRDLSLRLKALGANVSALVRNREKECAAHADSIAPIYLSELTNDYDAIVNTVPQCIFTDEMIKLTNNALLVDIASKPYGFNMEIAKLLNSKSALLPGIPGKSSPQTAGEILAEYIHYVLRRTSK